MTTKFITDAAEMMVRNDTQPRKPELSGGDRRKRAARRTGGLLRDVNINVSLETLIHVGRLARAIRSEDSPFTTTMIQRKSCGMLARSRLRETLYTTCFVHCSKLCSLFKDIVYRQSQRREVVL